MSLTVSDYYKYYYFLYYYRYDLTIYNYIFYFTNNLVQVNINCEIYRIV